MTDALELRLDTVWCNTPPARFVPRVDPSTEAFDLDGDWWIYDRQAKAFLSDNQVLATPVTVLASETYYDG